MSDAQAEKFVAVVRAAIVEFGYGQFKLLPMFPLSRKRAELRSGE